VFRNLSLVVVLALIASCALADGRPQPTATGIRIGNDDYKYQVVGGIDHVLTDGTFGYNGMTGWSTSLTGSLWHFVDLTGDFGNYYANGATVRSYMLGPSVSFPFFKRSRAFVHGLTGVSTFPEPVKTRFSMGFGGGLDVPFRERFTLRVLQADYYRASFGPAAGAEYLRVGFGVGYRFGERRARSAGCRPEWRGCFPAAPSTTIAAARSPLQRLKYPGRSVPVVRQPVFSLAAIPAMEGFRNGHRCEVSHRCCNPRPADEFLAPGAHAA
jgi:hypothetical protein